MFGFAVGFSSMVGLASNRRASCVSSSEFIMFMCSFMAFEYHSAGSGLLSGSGGFWLLSGPFSLCIIWVYVPGGFIGCQWLIIPWLFRNPCLSVHVSSCISVPNGSRHITRSLFFGRWCSMSIQLFIVVVLGGCWGWDLFSG